MAGNQVWSGGKKSASGIGFFVRTMIFAFVLQWGKPCFWVRGNLLSLKAFVSDCAAIVRIVRDCTVCKGRVFDHNVYEFC